MPEADRAAAVPVVTIDGPNASGKGAVSGLLARRLGWHLLDSGALYRLVALAAERAGVALDDRPGLARLAAGLAVEFRPSEPGEPPAVRLGGEDVSERLRTEARGAAASRVAVHPEVRDALRGLQRAFRRPPGLVADGRDMGTVVFPDAALKIFLTASPEVRAERRHKQLKQKGIDVNLSALSSAIAERDRRDRERETAPLTPAADAVEIDTSALSIAAVCERVCDLVEARGLHRAHDAGEQRD